jgi:hypothetical protein
VSSRPPSGGKPGATKTGVGALSVVVEPLRLQTRRGMSSQRVSVVDSRMSKFWRFRDGR